MNDQSPIRPCVEFPCDNPRLHASLGLASTADVAHSAEVADPFDWNATAHWVKETQRRWAAHDAPDHCLPVLDAAALEQTNVPPVAVELPTELPTERPEPAPSVKPSLATTEPLLTPHDGLDVDLADELEADLAAALTGEERVASGAVHPAPEFDVEAWLEAPESDPFIDELMGLVGRDAADVGGVFPELEESGEVRAMPRVAEIAGSDESPAPDLTSVKQPAQPLVPLFLELTPTPAIVGPWVSLTGVLSRYLLNAGHTRAAALLPPMLNGELVDLTRLPEAAISRLVIDAVAETRAGRVVTTSTFRDAARAFREAFSERSLNPSDALFWLGQLMVALCGGDVDDLALEAELEALGVMQLLENAA